MTKETTPASQRALDHASQLAGFMDWGDSNCADFDLQTSIQAHARTLDQLWERCPDLAPKTKGELFAEEMMRRWDGMGVTPAGIAAQMIDENWEPKP